MQPTPPTDHSAWLSTEFHRATVERSAWWLASRVSSLSAFVARALRWRSLSLSGALRRALSGALTLSGNNPLKVAHSPTFFASLSLSGQSRHDRVRKVPEMETLRKMPNTRRVLVFDMTTGAELRDTTTAGEAERASTLPLAGLNISQRLAVANGLVMSEAQRLAYKRTAERNAERTYQSEALALLAEMKNDEEARARFSSERLSALASTWADDID